MDGPAQIASALACQPDRIGHGWRIIDDCDVTDGRITSLGPTATALRDAGLPLEIEPAHKQPAGRNAGGGRGDAGAHARAARKAGEGALKQ